MDTLTKTELDIMEYVWKLGKASARDVIEAMNDLTIPHSTISSVLRILEKKSYVASEQVGRAYEYVPLITKKEYGGKSLKKVLQSFFNNSPKDLVSFLINEKEISEEDRKIISQQLEKLKKKPSEEN